MSLKWRLERRPTLGPDCRLEANHKMFLFVLAEAGAGHPRRARESERTGVARNDGVGLRAATDVR